MFYYNPYRTTFDEWYSKECFRRSSTEFFRGSNEVVFEVGGAFQFQPTDERALSCETPENDLAISFIPRTGTKQVVHCLSSRQALRFLHNLCLARVFNLPALV